MGASSMASGAVGASAVGAGAMNASAMAAGEGVLGTVLCITEGAAANARSSTRFTPEACYRSGGNLLLIIIPWPSIVFTPHTVSWASRSGPCGWLRRLRRWMVILGVAASASARSARRRCSTPGKRRLSCLRRGILFWRCGTRDLARAEVAKAATIVFLAGRHGL